MEINKDLENLINSVGSLVKENRALIAQIEDKDSIILNLNSKIDTLLQDKKAHSEFIASITPVKVYYTPRRKSTTVLFLDGSQTRVRRMKGDKNCLETAVVYAIYKKIYPKRLLVNLVNDVTKIKIGGRRCRKN